MIKVYEILCDLVKKEHVSKISLPSLFIIHVFRAVTDSF